ncbi:MAG: caspase family protein [Chitinophagaceae bacterium]|nr:caspase family protein [Chitinophagaceae bacterium]
MRILLLILLLFFSFRAKSQLSKPAPQTYAVVVGISQYENTAIPSLQYAHRDAEAFAAYLQTKAGGNVSPTQIRLLTGKEATTAAVYDALQWVMNVARENDLVYFYFAGHGDMENVTIYKLGFLLTYNTPANNYINNSIRLEDLNNFANTLSGGKKAKVVLITDACHSGKLAGSGYRGNFLVGNQLRDKVANEIRITSCSPDELSNENEAWGGGRGVFSFYLINGLIGFADEIKDGYVRLNEIKQYVDSAVAADPVLKANKVIQTPVIPVNDKTGNFVLSVADTALMKQEQQSGSIQVMAAPIPDLSGSPEMQVADFFQRMKEKDISKLTGLETLLQTPAASIPLSFIKICIKNAEADTLDAFGQRIRPDAAYQKQLQQVQQALTNNEAVVTVFKKELVLLLHTQTQQVINDYLEGSEAELERRRYYNAGSKGYDAYPVMLQIAMKLTDKDDFLYRAMEVNRYYFEGVALMLKIPLRENAAPLIDSALQMELKALALQEDAACVHNALGVLHLYKNNLPKAELHFTKAKEISPQWALPYSNLMGLYMQKKQYAKAQAMYDTAFALQPSLQNLYTNRGLLAELQNNFLMAEELQRKSIVLNSRHYYPFERLGFVYTKTTGYALADSFFYEADVRKRGFHLKPFKWSSVSPGIIEPFDRIVLCPFEKNRIKDNDVLGYFSLGFGEYLKKNYQDAEMYWKKVIELDPSNPLVFYWLGKMLFDHNRLKEADLLFSFAVDYFLDEEQLRNYADSLLQYSAHNPDSTCFLQNFMAGRYYREENHYFLADLYEQRNDYANAEQQYRILIPMQKGFIGPYKRLWQLLEKIGRYNDAEAVMFQYQSEEYQEGSNELNAFYKRVTDTFPGDGYWQLRAGLFLYAFVAASDKHFKEDKKAIFPDSNKPEKFYEKDMTPQGSSGPVELPGTKKLVYFASVIKTPISDGINYLMLADSLIGADEALSADINDKTGDLYLWQGLPSYAAVHYQQSVDMLPVNTSVRNKLIDVYNGLYQFSRAFINLDTLAARNELIFEKQVLYCKYFVHAGNYDAAVKYLLDADTVYPYPLLKLKDLFARMYLLSDNYKNALSYYRECLELQPNDSCAMYSISRVYALQKNNAKAIQWLRKAVDAGFNYGWVLKFDPAMQQLRKSSEYKSVMRRKMKEYPAPSNVYNRKKEQ